MEKTIVTRVRDFSAITVERRTGEIIVYIPQEHVPQLKNQFKVRYPEQLKGKEIFVDPMAHRIYPTANKSKGIGVFCNMEAL